MTKGVIVTIDGPAGSGKSTVSKLVSAALGYEYLDTGAIYRAIAYKAMIKGIPSDDEHAVYSICLGSEIELSTIGEKMKIAIDGEDVTGRIRSEEVGLMASKISTYQSVRKALLAIQQRIGASGGIVAEGRDMGTVVFPEAECKFFLDADVAERAKRRCMELVNRNENVELQAVEKDIALRDKQDRERQHAPLKAADDAIIVDTTALSIPEVVEAILAFVRKRIHAS